MSKIYAKYLNFLNSLFLILLLFFFSSAFSAQVNLHSWKESDYEKYNTTTFQKLDVVNSTISRENIDYELLSAAIFYATNIQRKKYRKPVFIHSKKLEEAAQKHSFNMVKHNFYSHTSPVKKNRTMSDRLKLVGIENAFSGENIFDYFQQNPTYWSMAVGLVDGWMKSKGHRENILDKNYKYLGCGVYYYSNKEWSDYFYVKSTQNFSSKKGS